jgi:hypothetical protein
VQECTILVPIDEVFYLAKLGEVLEVHQELNEMKPAVLDVALPCHRQAFLSVIDKLAEKPQLLDHHKAFFTLQHFLVADN